VEELLEGPEVSCLVFCDGSSCLLLPPAQDHKRQLDGDAGPNTGGQCPCLDSPLARDSHTPPPGMGAYAPCPLITEAMLQKVKTDIVEVCLRASFAPDQTRSTNCAADDTQPTLRGMAAEGHPYHGTLYVGLMLTRDGPRVLEYNCRFGDPETQVHSP
jgi:phosphoribosylamine-glycine ligase